MPFLEQRRSDVSGKILAVEERKRVSCYLNEQMVLVATVVHVSSAAVDSLVVTVAVRHMSTLNTAAVVLCNPWTYNKII